MIQYTSKHLLVAVVSIPRRFHVACLTRAKNHIWMRAQKTLPAQIATCLPSNSSFPTLSTCCYLCLSTIQPTINIIKINPQLPHSEPCRVQQGSRNGWEPPVLFQVHPIDQASLGWAANRDLLLYVRYPNLRQTWLAGKRWKNNLYINMMVLMGQSSISKRVVPLPCLITGRHSSSIPW